MGDSISLLDPAAAELDAPIPTPFFCCYFTEVDYVSLEANLASFGDTSALMPIVLSFFAPRLVPFFELYISCCKFVGIKFVTR